MASIPGPIMLIIGLCVSIFSYFLNDKSFTFGSSYALFLYAGLLFMFYGFVKTLIWFMTRKSDKEIKDEIKQEKENPQNDTKMSAFERMQRIDFDKEREAMTSRCKNCGMLHYAHANFCQNCGNRLK